jgi:CHAT domain-containing protein
MPLLRNAVPEARAVVDIATRFGVRVSLRTDTVPISEVLEQLRLSQIVHLACHGIQHKSEPHKSHFCFSTGDLTVSSLMEMELDDAFFAYLGACETAQGAQKYADETVHLAATMLFVGFKSVVATMW